MKKGRHRRYEEARALKRGSDLDIESIFSDLSEDSVLRDDDVEEDDDRPGYDDADDEAGYDDELDGELADEVERR